MLSAYKIDLKVVPGSHNTEEHVNKQINDKERFTAALENPKLLQSVEECILQEGETRTVDSSAFFWKYGNGSLFCWE